MLDFLGPDRCNGLLCDAASADLVAGLRSTLGAPLLAAYVAVKRSEAARFKDASCLEERDALWHRY